jgi:hypothetical protein
MEPKEILSVSFVPSKQETEADGEAQKLSGI